MGLEVFENYECENQMSIDDIEVWKDVDEFDGVYQISNFGRLKSVERTVKHPKGECVIKGKFLSEVVNKKGYIEYQITYNSKHYGRKAHRLVANAFIPNPQNLPQVNHIDGDKTNNKASNLEWCTNRHNVIHAYENQLHKTRPIIQFDLDGNEIKKWKSAGEIQRELGLRRSHIHEACKGKRKTFHGYVWKFESEVGNGTTVTI